MSSPVDHPPLEQRYPERSSSLSAIDFPHGPPNSPSSKTASPDRTSLNTVLTLVPDEEIPAISLNYKTEDEMEEEIVNAFRRSLSKYEIKEPMVNEFTFDPIDSQVHAEAPEIEKAMSMNLGLGMDKENVEVGRQAAMLTEMNKEGRMGTVDQRVVLHRKHRQVAALQDKDEVNGDKVEGTAPVQDTDLNDKDEALSEEETDSRCPSPVETPASAIVRPATPMVPLAFGHKSKSKTVVEEKDGHEESVAEVPPAEALQPMVAIPVAENYKENKLSPGQLVPKKTFVVAISGCSSAGKSVLAKILSTIFDPSLISTANSEGSMVKPTITIAQDDFFHPKALQPFVTFTSCPADAPFMEKSIHNDEFEMYYVAFSGTRPSHAPDTLLECPTGTRHAQRTDSFNSDKSDASRLLEGGHRPRYQVTGPNPDCDQALDFVGLVEAINSVKTTGHLTEYEKRFPCDEDMGQYAALIANMKEKVSGWVKEQAVLNAEARFGGCVVRGPIENDGKKVVGAGAHGKGNASLRPQFVFVEGFLLFADVSTSESGRKSSSGRANARSVYNIAAEKAKINKYIKQLDGLSAELATKDNIDESIEGERDVIEAQFWATNLQAKKYLQGLFDVKLFLNTSKAESKRRRFERAIYRDAPEGGRLPGQMWKSEGFFEEAVWKGFEEGYKWLLESETEAEVEKGDEGMHLVTKKGVFFEPVQDVSANAVVEWAVDVLLAEMGRLEGEARIAGGGCCTDD